MALLLTTDGEVAALRALVNFLAGQNLVLRLFRNDFTPDTYATVSDLVEATFVGYSAITLTGASWTVSGGVASYAQQTFTSSASSQNQTIYGYYMTQESSSLLAWVERFPSSMNIADLNDVIRVTPRIECN